MEKEFDKKYTWVIKNFSSLQSEKIYSNHFVNGGCKWRFRVYPKGFRDSNCLAVYLGVADFDTLPSGWKIHANFRLTIVNQYQKKLSRRRDIQQWFVASTYNWGFDSFLPLTELHAKDSGFLVNGEFMVVAEVNVLEVIGQLDVTEETSPVMESMDINGFHVLSSQAESVKRLFDRHPDIASTFRPENPFLKTAYMTLLLSVTKSLSQSPQEISKNDLADASAAAISLKVAGFSLDWLEKRLEEVKKNKERAVAAETRMHKIDEKLKGLKDKFSDLEALLEKEKAEILASCDSLNLDDVF